MQQSLIEIYMSLFACVQDKVGFGNFYIVSFISLEMSYMANIVNLVQFSKD